MKKNICYVVCWDKIKEKTWSGTAWNLFKALSSKIDMVTVDVSCVKPTLYRRLKNYFGSKYKPELDLGLLGKQKKNVNKKISEKSCVFQFTEYVCDTLFRSTYIYIDMNLDYLVFLAKKAPDVFAKSSYSYDQLPKISARASQQNLYFKECSGIFTMGRWVADDLVNRLGIPKEKVHCVGGGISLDKQNVKPKNKTGNKILFIGRDFIRKGGVETYEAFKLLKNKIKNVELYVAGPKVNPYPSSEVDGYHFIGDCDRSKIIDLLNTCDIFCMPSFYEAYGLVFIEALAFGLPCIGRNCFEMPYFIEEGKTGLLLYNNDINEYVDKMFNLLNNSEIKDNVKGLKDFYFEHYSWNNVAQKIIKTIQRDETHKK